MTRRADPYKAPQTQANSLDREREQARPLQPSVGKDRRQWLLPTAALVQPPMPYATTALHNAAFSVSPGEDPSLAAGREATATRVLKTIPAGASGAVKLTRRYGPALICVRYRTDATGSVRYTTVELIIEQVAVQHRAASTHMVAVRFAYNESLLRSQAVKLGAKWHSQTRLWHMPKAAAKKLGLISRITKDTQR